MYEEEVKEMGEEELWEEEVRQMEEEVEEMVKEEE